MEFEKKEVLVVGIGKSGLAAIDALNTLGARVSVLDSKSDIDPKTKQLLEKKTKNRYYGQEPASNFKWDFFVLSPGVPTDLTFISKARKKGTKIIGELELAYIISEGTYIGITGTNGKTTTTTLVGEIFKNDNKKAVVVGNIGNPVVTEAIRGDEDTYFITEISSFQLETIDTFKPKVSAILNLTEDHMDRHKTMEIYGYCKGKIGKNQDENDYLVLNKDSEETVKLGKKSNAKKVYFSRKEEVTGAFLRGKEIILRDFDSNEINICNVCDLKMPGNHNVENVLASICISYFAGVGIDTIKKTITTFTGVPHRVEIFLKKNGITYVNDSKGTNPDASIKAIEAMKENIILIAGGYDKNGDFEELLTFAKDKVKAVLLLGQTKEKIYDACKKIGIENVHIFNNLDECVEYAVSHGVEGDKVLLSPACASWGMYNNFEERGEHFKKSVLERVNG